MHGEKKAMNKRITDREGQHVCKALNRGPFLLSVDVPTADVASMAARNMAQVAVGIMAAVGSPKRQKRSKAKG